MNLFGGKFSFAIFALILLTLTLSEYKSVVICESVIPKKTCYCLEEITSSLYNPVMASFVKRKGKEGIIVAEQRGVLKLVTRDSTKTMLDIRQRVVSTDDYGDERGLLSAVPSPDFDENGKMYVAYTRQDKGQEYTYISEFTTDKDLKVDERSERYLLRVYQPFERGNGGPMFFGDDGYLYIVTGDGGAQDDVLGNAQNKHSFHGSVLRIDVTGGQDFTDGESSFAKSYKVPQDNPFVDVSNTTEEIYAYGFRNMWGCSQDSKSRGGDGRIYCAETGTTFFDEINIIEKGKNYGWNLKEGSKCYHSTACQSVENEALPAYEFPHTGQHALVGGYVYRGHDFAWLYAGNTNYIFGDVITGKVRVLLEEPTMKNWTASEWLVCNQMDCADGSRGIPLKHILAFSQDTDGELYLLMVDALKAHSPEGKIFKMTPSNSAPKGLAASSLYIITLNVLIVLRTSVWFM